MNEAASANSGVEPLVIILFWKNAVSKGILSDTALSKIVVASVSFVIFTELILPSKTFVPNKVPVATLRSE